MVRSRTPRASPNPHSPTVPEKDPIQFAMARAAFEPRCFTHAFHAKTWQRTASDEAQMLLSSCGNRPIAEEVEYEEDHWSWVANQWTTVRSNWELANT